MNSPKFVFERSLHRRLGILVAFFLILLTISGMLLNHSKQLDLVNKPLNGFVASLLYGSHALADVQGWHANDRWFYAAGNQLYMDGQQLGFCRNPIRGVVNVSGLWFVLCNEELLLLDPAGQLIERTHVALEGPARLGKANNEGLLEINGRIGVLDAATLQASTWSGTNDKVRWSAPGNLPDKWSAGISGTTPELNLERLILDLHSGRVLGQWHTLFLDLLGVLLLLLAVGGIRMWYARKS